MPDPASRRSAPALVRARAEPQPSGRLAANERPKCEGAPTRPFALEKTGARSVALRGERLRLDAVEFALRDRTAVEQLLRLFDLRRDAAAGPGSRLDVCVELGLLLLRSLEVALGHALVLRN